MIMDSSAKITSSSNNYNNDFLNSIPWKRFGSAVLSLPLIGLGFGIVYSILYNFEASNQTHCRVWNFLPSVSAATGSFEPQMSVWWWCIVIHTPARYFFCVSYMVYYNTISSIRWRKVNSLLILCSIMLNMIEITALLLLTLVTSRSNFDIHKSSFAIFMIASLLYMIATVSLQTSLVNDTRNLLLLKSLRYKKVYLACNLLSILTSLYMYWRHNTHCEPGVYSLFSLSEYIIVLSNIAYHSTAILDFTSILPLVPDTNAVMRVPFMEV